MSYADSLAKDRDKYQRKAGVLARHLRALLATPESRGVQNAARKALLEYELTEIKVADAILATVGL